LYNDFGFPVGRGGERKKRGWQGAKKKVREKVGEARRGKQLKERSRRRMAYT